MSDFDVAEAQSPQIEGQQVVYSTFVRRGMMLVNRGALDFDDPDHIYNHLKSHGITPEDFGIRHPLEEEFKNKTRGELIAEILALRSTILGYERAGF